MNDKVNTSSKVPLLSNAAAGAITGFLTLLISSWGGHLPYFEGDFSSIKSWLLMLLPSLAMLLAHGIKSIGFKWSLGSVNRQLLSINKAREKEINKNIKKYNGVLSVAHIDKYKDDLAQVLQDRHDILANKFREKVKERNLVQERYTDHQERPVNENEELQELLKPNPENN